MDPWNPAQYDRFKSQRMEPFFDLIALVEQKPSMQILDLGCGTGEITAMIASRFDGSNVTGVDSSDAMLREAAAHERERLRFESGDIGQSREYGHADLVFSNAALQWVPNHERVIGEMLAGMKSGSQVAIQMPRNFDSPSHTAAATVAARPAFSSKFAGKLRLHGTLSMERYAQMLHQHGFRTQVCFEKIYGHELAHSSDVVEWVKGTMLNAYLPHLDDDDKIRFVSQYRDELTSQIGEHSPYFFPFRRLLVWGRKS